jgi:predicted NUDIX family NTP pyrophosphohydrolase
MQKVVPGQTFQWKIADINVPILFAEFSGRIRDERGNIILELNNEEHFDIEDAESGTFSVSPPPVQDGRMIEIYGQLPGTNRVIIYKGEYSDE